MHIFLGFIYSIAHYIVLNLFFLILSLIDFRVINQVIGGGKHLLVGKQFILLLLYNKIAF
jgi:hypothetical protein